jgi:AcrR family transcriptional regulator
LDKTRRQKERAHRRELLLEAAERAFGRKPFDVATMQDVAAEAQIGMQGLYQHFPSKQALYEQILLHRAEGFRRRAEAAVAGLDDPLAQLRALATAYVDAFEEQPMFLPMFLKERVHYDWGFRSRVSPRVHEIYAAEKARLSGILTEATRRGQVLALPADFLAQLCLEVLDASIHYHQANPGEEVRACVERAMDAFLGGVRARS